MKLTKEQQEIVDLVLSDYSNGKIIAVNSIAGAGKTSTAKAIVEAYNPSSGLYTAFNKSIVEESKRKIQGINVNTLHSFAFKYSINKNIESLSYKSILEDVRYEVKKVIIDLLEAYFLSSEIHIEDFARNSEKYNEDVLSPGIVDIAKSYFKKMIRNEMPATYNFMLKFLHGLLYNGSIGKNNFKINFDLIILDECQDTTAVALEIFKLINSKKKVLLGDSHQNIYGFMNTVNAFELIDNIIEKRLTQSFRCTNAIAKKIEKFGLDYFNDNFSYRGNPEIKETNIISSYVYLSRSNIGLIQTMIDFHKNNKRYRLVRTSDSIFEFIVSLYEASEGQNVTCRKYNYLEDEYRRMFGSRLNARESYFERIVEVFPNDTDIKAGVSLLKQLGDTSIKDVQKRSIKMIDPNSNVILSTAHTFKGLEADKVILNDDLQRSYDVNLEKCESLIENYILSLSSHVEETMKKLKIRGYNKEEHKEIATLLFVETLKLLMNNNLKPMLKIVFDVFKKYVDEHEYLTSLYDDIFPRIENIISVNELKNLLLKDIKDILNEFNLYYVAISRAKLEIENLYDEYTADLPELDLLAAADVLFSNQSNLALYEDSSKDRTKESYKEIKKSISNNKNRANTKNKSKKPSSPKKSNKKGTNSKKKNS